MREIASGVWLAEGRTGWGHSNAVLVAGQREGLLFDCQFTVRAGRALAERSREIVASGATTLVYSHANPDHTWGSAALPDAEVVASRATADEMPAETGAEAMRQLLALPDPAPGSGAAYLQQHFSCFDFADVPEPRTPTRTYSDRLELTAGGRDIELLCVGPAHTAGDTVAYLADVSVALTGDILFIDDHAVSWGAPLTGWVRALDTLLALDARQYVPGHGPVVARDGVTRMRDYLLSVDAFARTAYAAGRPLLDAAREFGAGERYGWALPERVVTLLASVYRELGADGDNAQLGLLGLIAAHDAEFAC